MAAYYNEIDAGAAAWLRVLIERGMIAQGDVDERSITEVTPDDVRGYTQCHFFAGIGGWSYALRLAGVPDDRPVWTGSAPCQPFSVAGSQRGSDDERHLWPAFFRIIRECSPPAIFGEQVAGASGLAWLDHVFADLEDADYAVAAANLCAAGAGAPQIRQRLYWVADAASTRAKENIGGLRGVSGGGISNDSLANTNSEDRRSDENQSNTGTDGRGLFGGGGGTDGDMDDAKCKRLEGHWACGTKERPAGCLRTETGPVTTAGIPDPWRDLLWLPCTDGKYRPTKRGIQPLATRLPKSLVRGGDRGMAPNSEASQEARVMRLRGYGNAIVPQVAALFIDAAMGVDMRHCPTKIMDLEAEQ